jgi:hypothetical protein
MNKGNIFLCVFFCSAVDSEIESTDTCHDPETIVLISNQINALCIMTS